MVKKAMMISKMKYGKAAGPSGLVVEMIREAGVTGATMIHDHAIAITQDVKGKGDALDSGNYRGLKLTEQAMKVIERIADSLIRQVVTINESQFGFLPSRGTTDAFFVVCQLQEKYLALGKWIYMAFLNLEKAFDQVPQNVIWWAMRKIGVMVWIVKLVQQMYKNVWSGVQVGEGLSDKFEVRVGVHQGSLLSPLLFIVVLEALP